MGCSRFFLLACAIGLRAQITTMAPPPAAPVRPVTDDYYGRKITDPYRYMENLKDPEVQAWFRAQNDYTRATLARIPGRAALLARIWELDESAPARISDLRRLPGDRIFYQKLLPKEEVPKLYTRMGLNSAEVLLVDPARMPAPANGHYSLSYYAPSPDGRYVAYGVSLSGSEDAVLHVVETATGKETGDLIDRAQFGDPAWRPDGRSFFYNRLQKTGPASKPTDLYLKSRVFLHVMGKDPESDRAVFGSDLSTKVAMAEADIPFIVTVPESPYFFGVIAHGVQREFTIYLASFAAADGPDIPWQKLCDTDEAVTAFDVHGDDIYLLTHKGASRYKITQTRLDRPDVAGAEVVLPAAQAVARYVVAARDGVYVELLDGGIGRVVRLPYGGGKPETIPLPFEGAVSVAASDPRVPGVLLNVISWNRAGRIYAYDPASRQTTDTGLQPKGPLDDPSDVQAEEVKAPSYDATPVPLSIVHRRGVKLDGSNPTMLIGYGAYGFSMLPFFDPKRLAWIEHGGIFAMAHVRGGGEYGEDWHLAGKMLTKPNTWRDMIACAEWLIQHKYTSPAKLGIQGASAGGITIGRSITERPDLFAAAVDSVPMSDVVRAEFTPNGPPNIPEFGSVKTEEGFEDLLAMSAYHHIEDGALYPAVMVTTGFNDPRVISWEPGKMAARLAAATASGKPILLRVDYQAGHGIGSRKTQQIEQMADIMSFFLWQFGDPAFQPK